MLNRIKVGILVAAGLICLSALVVYAADGEFAGKWKGEMKAAPVPEGGAAGAGGRGGFGGGGRGGGGGFGGGGGSQKISLNLKHDAKTNKLSGNIVLNDNADDVKDGMVEGNKIYFKAGRAPQPIYEYSGVMLKENELTLTRKADGARGRAIEYVLTRK